MSERRSTGDNRGEPEFVNTATCGDDVLDRHIEAALESTTDSEARYHLREALQLVRGWG